MGDTPDVAVLVPMLGRPGAVEPLALSLQAATDRCRLVFVLSPDDHEVRLEVERLDAEHLIIAQAAGPGDYARKINAGAAVTCEPWIFTGASDIRFAPGFVEKAIDPHAENPRFMVVGTNDLGNSLVRAGRHSTHSFVRRAYLLEAVIDEPGALYSTAYEHNYVDMELVDYAISKGVFWSARQSIVEHFHPDWRKADVDDTYRLGKEGFMRDNRLFQERRQRWRPLNPRAAARSRITRHVR